MAWILCCLAGCGLARDKAPKATPSDVVKAFFEAAAQGDCARLRGLAAEHVLDELKGDEACREALGALHAERFEGVIDTRLDGRDKSVQTVRVRIQGKDAPALIRVRKIRGAHKVVSL